MSSRYLELPYFSYPNQPFYLRDFQFVAKIQNWKFKKKKKTKPKLAIVYIALYPITTIKVVIVIRICSFIAHDNLFYKIILQSLLLIITSFRDLQTFLRVLFSQQIGVTEFALQVVLKGSQSLFIMRPNRFALVTQGTFQGIVLVFTSRSILLET